MGKWVSWIKLQIEYPHLQCVLRMSESSLKYLKVTSCSFPNRPEALPSRKPLKSSKTRALIPKVLISNPSQLEREASRAFA